MIDVVFLLLVFFLLSSKFLAEEKTLDTVLPKDGTNSALETPQMARSVMVDLRVRGDELVPLVRTVGYSGSERALADLPRISLKEEQIYPSVGFGEIEVALAQAGEAFGRAVPVTVHFGSDVPTQAVVGVLDICKRLGFRDFAIAAPEIES